MTFCCDGNGRVSTAYSLSTAMKAVRGTRGVIECKVALVCGCLIHIAFCFNLRIIAVCLFFFNIVFSYYFSFICANGMTSWEVQHSMPQRTWWEKRKHGFLTRKSLLVNGFSLVIPNLCVFWDLKDGFCHLNWKFIDESVNQLRVLMILCFALYSTTTYNKVPYVMPLESAAITIETCMLQNGEKEFSLAQLCLRLH